MENENTNAAQAAVQATPAFETAQEEYVLKTENLGISFGGLKAAQNVNLRIKKGALYGLIGPNGAGKTTVFNMLTGVYKPTTGKFFLCGEDLTGLD